MWVFCRYSWRCQEPGAPPQSGGKGDRVASLAGGAIVKIEKLRPGMTVWSVSRRRLGSTTLSTVAVRAIKIVSVDLESGSVMATWNGNRPTRFYGRVIAKWRATEPVLVPTGVFGRHRVATRAELRDRALSKQPEIR